MKLLILYLAFFFVLFQARYTNAQTLDEQFPTVNGSVKTILIHGNTMYIGGTFTSVGGKLRKNIAAIDIPSKSVTDWSLSLDGDVVDIEAANGKVFFCGHFKTVSSNSRNALAIVDSITGSVDPLNPVIVFPGVPGMQTGTISSIEITKNTLYLAGYFISVNGASRKNVASIDLLSGNLNSFQVNPDIPVNIIKIDGNILYLGGPFYSVNGLNRAGFAAVKRINGEMLPWAPLSGTPGNTIYSIVPDGDSVIISGIFENLNNSNHCFLAKTDLTGAASNWSPFNCSGAFPFARAVLIADDHLIIGGQFTAFSGINRNNLVMVHNHTGVVDSWQPEPDNSVLSIAGNDSLIAVGGDFNIISGVTRPYLAVYSKSGLQSDTNELGLTTVKVTGYPNPTHSSFTIPLDQTDLKNVSIYTKDGKIVKPNYQISEHSLIINTGQLQTGEYVVHFETANGQKHLSMFTKLNR